MKKLLLCSWFAIAIGFPLRLAAWPTPVYLSGHADIGVEYLTGPSRLELNIRLDGDTQFSDGHDLSLQVVSPDEVAIRVPSPPLYRQHYTGDPLDPDDDYDVTGPQWDFLGVDQDEPFWFLPQSSDPLKPFFGFATDGLTFSEWTGDVTWSLEDIVCAPEGGEVSLWQTNFFGEPQIKFASGGAFTQPLGGHDHYNWGFSKPGIYEVELGAEAERVGVGSVYGSAVFTFLVGVNPGDFNDDGSVDEADVPLFVQALVDRADYDAAFPELDADLIGDLNKDGYFNLGDVRAFKDLFGVPAASAQAAPEPSTAVFLAIASALSLATRRSFMATAR